MIKIWDGTFREPKYWVYFGNRLVELAEIGTGARVLDVGTGWSGAVLFPAVNAVGPQGRVIGIDKWEPYLKETATAIQECGLDNAETMLMDVRSMDFEDGSFDVVLSGFVGWADVFDFTRCEYIDRDRKIEEISRVLKSGGRVGISAWAMQEDNEWMGEILNKHLPTNGVENTEQVPLWRYSKETVEGLEKILHSAGFQDIKVVTEKKAFVYQDEGEWLAVMESYGWANYLERVKRLHPDARWRFEQNVVDKLHSYKQADGIHFTRTVLFALGTK